MSYTDFKEVTNPTVGTATKYGSSHILEIMQILNGKTVANRRPKITNEWLWQNHFDITEVTEPASPTSGNQRFYIDSSDHALKLKNSSGTVTSFGGGVSINQANTFGDYDQTFRSGRLDVRNPANTYSYSITGSAIAAARAVTLPLLTGDDTLVCQAFAQALTNKTIEVNNNTIKHSTTNAAGDLLISNGTSFQRIARGTANQVLTVNAGGTDIAWAAPAAGGGNVSTGQINTYGDYNQIFRSSRLLVTNPANTFNYNFTGAAIAAARTITLPLLTGNDTMVTEAFTQTVTNKTIGVDNNTVKHSTTNAAGDLLISDGSKFNRVPRGTANQVLAVNSGGTDLAWTSINTGAAREDIATLWPQVMRTSQTSSYGNMKFIYDNQIETTDQLLDDAVMNCDFTGKTQFRAQFTLRRNENVAHANPGSSVVAVEVVDSTNAANVLFEKTNISTDTRQTVTLTSIPAWATGAQTLVPATKQTSGTGAFTVVVGLTIWLK